MKIELNEQEIIKLAREDYENDVNFLYRLVDECTTKFEPIEELIKKLYDIMEKENKDNIKKYINGIS